MVGMAGTTKKILARARDRVRETRGRLRQRTAAWKQKRFLRNAYQFGVGMRRELEDATSYLAVAIDSEGNVRHHSEIPEHVVPGIENCIKNLAVSFNAAESIATMQRFPGPKESALQKELQADRMRTKRRELEKKHGTVEEGNGRKYYIEFLVKKRLAPLIMAAESQRRLLLEFLEKEGHAQ